MAKIGQLQSERDELMSQLNDVRRQIIKYRDMVRKVDAVVIASRLPA